jgi:hypothetical protein
MAQALAARRPAILARQSLQGGDTDLELGGQRVHRLVGVFVAMT